MEGLLIIILLIVLLFLMGWWWRYHSLACPASLSWLLENPFMNAIAGSGLIIQRAGILAGMNVLDIGCGPGSCSWWEGNGSRYPEKHDR